MLGTPPPLSLCAAWIVQVGSPWPVCRTGLWSPRGPAPAPAPASHIPLLPALPFRWAAEPWVLSCWLPMGAWASVWSVSWPPVVHPPPGHRATRWLSCPHHRCPALHFRLMVAVGQWRGLPLGLGLPLHRGWARCRPSPQPPPVRAFSTADWMQCWPPPTCSTFCVWRVGWGHHRSPGPWWGDLSGTRQQICPCSAVCGQWLGPGPWLRGVRESRATSPPVCGCRLCWGPPPVFESGTLPGMLVCLEKEGGGGFAGWLVGWFWRGKQK